MTNQPPFPIIFVEGDTHEMGRQYGSQCRDLIGQALDIYRESFKIDADLDWEPALALARKFIPFAKAFPAAMEEIQGIAEGSGRTLDEIILLNARTQLPVLAAGGGSVGGECTSVGAMPEATLSGHLIMGQNWDWKRATQKVTVLLKKKPKSGPSVVTLVEAGVLARLGFNSAGIGIVANALTTDGWSIGVPSGVALHGLFRSESLQTTPRPGVSTRAQRVGGSSGNTMFGWTGGPGADDFDGYIVDFESAPQGRNVIFPEDGIIAHANHFTVPNPNIRDLYIGANPHSYWRGYRATRLMARARGNITVDVIKKILTDHFGKPYSICRHPDPNLEENLQMQTNATIVFNLHEKTLDIAKGPPCENEFAHLTFEDIM